jgi:large subunit ribosomal protein L27Ae
MRYFHKTMNQYYSNIINIDKLVSLLPAGAPKDAVPVIDARALGYTKVLGNGHVARPMIVKARFVSRKAELKITEAGGKIELVA